MFFKKIVIIASVFFNIFFTIGLYSQTQSSVVVTVEIIPSAIDDFIEFKIESDQKGEKSTGHIKVNNQKYISNWDMGGSNQNIWFWWDNLNGDTFIKITVTTSGSATVIFEGKCKNTDNGEVNVIKTSYQTMINKENGTPRIENTGGDIMYIKF